MKRNRKAATSTASSNRGHAQAEEESTFALDAAIHGHNLAEIDAFLRSDELAALDAARVNNKSRPGFAEGLQSLRAAALEAHQRDDLDAMRAWLVALRSRVTQTRYMRATMRGQKMQGGASAGGRKKSENQRALEKERKERWGALVKKQPATARALVDKKNASAVARILAREELPTVLTGLITEELKKKKKSIDADAIAAQAAAAAFKATEANSPELKALVDSIRRQVGREGWLQK